MKKLARSIFLLAALAAFNFSIATETDISTIEELNSKLPLWGTTWTPGKGSVGGYYPSFYTGFAMRSEAPERIRVHVGRGNSTRVSVILDHETLHNYLFDLVARAEFYKDVVQRGIVDVNPSGSDLLPMMSFYQQILESPTYGILSFVNKAKSGGVSKTQIYQKSLSTLIQLNPDRIFQLSIDLRREFIKWKQQILANGVESLSSPASAAVALNTLVWGRVNYTEKPSQALIDQVRSTAELAAGGSEDQFVLAARDLFIAATGSVYQFQVLGRDGQWRSPIQCASARNCRLVYPEFTTIYPTGSVKQTTRDSFGNSITDYATPGLWRFVSRGTIDVDNIREEQYYGWIPKMDYEAAGNGFHNPGVRFYKPPRSVREALGLNMDHTTFWSVKRGGVSHGCLRLPSGHAWELRHIFPVENEKMAQVYFFGHRPQDFDLYDINGDGELEVMGVEYLISYGLQGANGLAKREGRDLEVNVDRKNEFYNELYGSRNVFEVAGDGSFVFVNPPTAIHTYQDFKNKRMTHRFALSGRYRLYEQTYEKDKIQLYAPFTTTGLNEKGQSQLSKRIVRLMGRVRGCAPDVDKNRCGQNRFQSEAASLIQETGR